VTAKRFDLAQCQSDMLVFLVDLDNDTAAPSTLLATWAMGSAAVA
jgi:hypothetical protein